jgi:hypothetical protein
MAVFFLQRNCPYGDAIRGKKVQMNRKYQGNTRVIANNTHHTRPTNPGVVMLTQAADQKVLKECDKIAEALAVQAIKGNASSARLLVDLAEGAEWVKDPETVERVLSVVERWMKEPKCDEEIGEMPAGVLASEGNFAATGDSASPVYVN